MTDHAAHALARWCVLPVLDAHSSRLPPRYSPGTPRALRLASAQLIAQSGCVPSRAESRAAAIPQLPIEARQWRQAALAAGVRCFSAPLRRLTGSALSSRLSAEMGLDAWRTALRWVEHGLDPDADLLQEDALDLVACAGSEILLAQLHAAGAEFRTRVRLRFPAPDVQACESALARLDSAACARIAAVVLGQGRA